MLFYKPEPYILPSSQPSQSQVGKVINPTKGETGNPSIPPTRQHMILKQGPLKQTGLKFLRNTLTNDDIEGSKPKRLYQGRTKDILSNLDIEGSSPARVKERDLTQYNIFDYSDVSMRSTLKSTAKRSPLPPPRLKVKRPNGESFFFESNADFLSSAQSSRLNQSFQHIPTKQQFHNSAMVYHPSHKRLDSFGQSIKDLQDANFPKIHNIKTMPTRNPEVHDRRMSMNRSIAVSKPSLQSPGQSQLKFHEIFSKKVNSPTVTNSLRTRPTRIKVASTVENSEYMPSIQKYNKRGKLY